MNEPDPPDAAPSPTRRVRQGLLQLTLRDVLALLVIAALALGWWSAARRVETAATRAIPEQFGPCRLEVHQLEGHRGGFRFEALEIRDGYAFGRDPDGTVAVIPLGDRTWSIIPVTVSVASEGTTAAEAVEAVSEH